MYTRACILARHVHKQEMHTSHDTTLCASGDAWVQMLLARSSFGDGISKATTVCMQTIRTLMHRRFANLHVRGSKT